MRPDVGRLLHWLTVVLLVLQVAAGFAMVALDADATLLGLDGARLWDLHRLGGVTLFSLTLGRLAWRHRTGREAGPAGGGLGLERLLLAMLLALPVSGVVAMLWAKGAIVHRIAQALLLAAVATHLVRVAGRWPQTGRPARPARGAIMRATVRRGAEPPKERSP